MTLYTHAVQVNKHSTLGLPVIRPGKLGLPMIKVNNFIIVNYTVAQDGKISYPINPRFRFYRIIKIRFPNGIIGNFLTLFFPLLLQVVYRVSFKDRSLGINSFQLQI